MGCDNLHITGHHDRRLGLDVDAVLAPETTLVTAAVPTQGSTPCTCEGLTSLIPILCKQYPFLQVVVVRITVG